MLLGLLGNLSLGGPQLLLDDPRRFGLEAVADPEVGMDVGPARRALLQLLAQLADEDVDRAVAVGHRVAPDPLVDLLPLKHLAALLGQQVEQLELAAGELEGLLADEGLEAVRADLQLTGAEGRALGLAAAAGVAAADSFDPGDRLLGRPGLAHPVAHAEPEGTDPLRDRRAAGADDEAELRQQPGDPLEVGPGFVPEQGRVDQQRVQLHRHEVSWRHGPGAAAEGPAGSFGTLGKDGDEAAVGVDHGDADSRSVCTRLARIANTERAQPILPPLGWGRNRKG